MKPRLVPAVLAASMLELLPGCYLSFGRDGEIASDDAAPWSDASVHAATQADPSSEAPPRPGPTIEALDAGPGCPPIEQVIDVARGTCEQLVVPSTEGNSCVWGDESRAARLVRVRRAQPGDWSILIRSRGIADGTIAYGFVEPGRCNVCNAHASASGGDLRLSGVGGDIPRDATELDLVLDAEDGAMWLRICDLAR